MPAGQNTLAIEVTAEDGTVQTYTFTLTRVTPVKVKFGDGPFSVDEGDSLSIPVILNQAAPLALTIPLTATDLNQADADDYSIPSSVEFLAGESEKSAVFSATADSSHRFRRAGEARFWHTADVRVFGQPEVGNCRHQRCLVNFEQLSYTVSEGDSVTVRVTLDSAADAQVDIPITATNQGGATGADYSAVPTEVTIASGASEGSFTFTAVEDSATDPDESVRFTLGSLPTGYTAGPTDETTVDIVDTTTVGTVPDTPNRPTGTAVFVGGVDLEWNDVPGADSYDVQLYRNGGWTDLPGDGVEIAFYGAGAIISGLDPTATLWFQVRARNSHGASGWSAFRQMSSTSQSDAGETAQTCQRGGHWHS